MRTFGMLSLAVLCLTSQAYAAATGAEAEKIKTMLQQLEQAQALCIKNDRNYSCADASAAIAYRYELSGAGITTAKQFVEQIAPAKVYDMQFQGDGLKITTTEFLRESLQQLETAE